MIFNKEKIVYILLLTLCSLFALSTFNAVSVNETNGTAIKLIVNDQETTAQMISNPTSDEFLKLLPLELELHDLFNREKYAQLPRTITDNSTKTSSYEGGYIAYYSPTNSIAIYYADDNEEISEGIIPLAIINGSVDMFKENNTKVRIELVN